MSVQFPRPIDTGARIYGLGMRQLVYLAVSVSLGGLFALGVFTPDWPFLVRGLIALVCVGAGVALAFLKTKGDWLDEHLRYGLRYLLLVPKRRVWRREGEAVEIVGGAPAIVPDAPLVSLELRRDESVPVAAVVALLNLIVLSLLALATFYMARGGLADLRGWLRRGGL